MLNERLADAIDLQTQCKQAHWNVKGPSFIALHKLFDEINAEVEDYVDLLAERIVQLGGSRTGRPGRSQSDRRSRPTEQAVPTGGSTFRRLQTALAAFGSLIRSAIARADALGDADTADIFTEISRGTDKWLWMVEAHIGAGQ